MRKEEGKRCIYTPQTWRVTVLLEERLTRGNLTYPWKPPDLPRGNRPPDLPVESDRKGLYCMRRRPRDVGSPLPGYLPSNIQSPKKKVTVDVTSACKKPTLGKGPKPKVTSKVERQNEKKQTVQVMP